MEDVSYRGVCNPFLFGGAKVEILSTQNPNTKVDEEIIAAIRTLMRPFCLKGQLIDWLKKGYDPQGSRIQTNQLFN
jgi:hypothetical protein